MAEKQISFQKENHKFKNIQITISDSMCVSINPDSITLKQTDILGKSKSIVIEKVNWFEMMNFTKIIQSCFT